MSNETKVGGQPGSKNRARGKDIRDSFRRAVAKLGMKLDGEEGAYQKGLDALCLIQVKAALEGSLASMQMISDRIDGKPHQSIDIGLSADTAAEEMSDVELDDELTRIRDLISGEARKDTSAKKPTSVH